MDHKAERIWERTHAMRPVIEAHRGEGDSLCRLPDAIAKAFVEANVYRLLVPEEFGGEGIDPITFYDLVEEVSSYDGSVGWNYSIATTAAIMIGDLPVERLKAIFATPDSCVAGAATPPGRAVAADGAYRITGRWAWASGIHQAKLEVRNSSWPTFTFQRISRCAFSAGNRGIRIRYFGCRQRSSATTTSAC
jgi:alkylation response protein AidB-like acyl-CoA dehydrogenase